MSRNHTTRHTLRNTSHTFVPAERTPPPPTQITPYVVGEILPPASHNWRAVDENDAIVHAKATLLVSAAYIVAALMITTGLLLIVFLFRGLGDAVALYFYAGILMWGVCILAALLMNRRQSLHHSSTGLGHAEISSRERLAKHAIDTHASLLLKRWKVDDEH